MGGQITLRAGEAHIDPRIFVEGMALVPGPVTIITTGDEQERRGLAASSFSSLSTDPPSVLVRISKSASAHDMVLAKGFFGGSLLPTDQHEVAQLFAPKDIDRFARHDWTTLCTGAPLLGDAAVAFDCRVIASIDAFSHTIVIGQVEDMVAGANDDPECLIWHRRRFGRSTALAAG